MLILCVRVIVILVLLSLFVNLLNGIRTNYGMNFMLSTLSVSTSPLMLLCLLSIYLCATAAQHLSGVVLCHPSCRFATFRPTDSMFYCLHWPALCVYSFSIADWRLLFLHAPVPVLSCACHLLCSCTVLWGTIFSTCTLRAASTCRLFSPHSAYFLFAIVACCSVGAIACFFFASVLVC